MHLYYMDVYSLDLLSYWIKIHDVGFTFYFVQPGPIYKMERMPNSTG